MEQASSTKGKTKESEATIGDIWGCKLGNFVRFWTTLERAPELPSFLLEPDSSFDTIQQFLHHLGEDWNAALQEQAVEPETLLKLVNGYSTQWGHLLKVFLDARSQEEIDKLKRYAAFASIVTYGDLNSTLEDSHGDSSGAAEESG